MQQLEDKLESPDADFFLHQLFLQGLPANVRMVLASVDTSIDVNKLAQIADKIKEVVTSTVSAVSNTRITAAILDSSEV